MIGILSVAQRGNIGNGNRDTLSRQAFRAVKSKLLARDAQSVFQSFAFDFVIPGAAMTLSFSALCGNAGKAAIKNDNSKLTIFFK